VRELLHTRDLPVAFDRASVDVEAVLTAVTRDKKRLGMGGVPFVLLSQPGQPRIGCEVSDSELRQAVTELSAS
jgi:3-dehydroquinate synthetase